MTMAEKDPPKLTRKPSKAILRKSGSTLSIDSKIKIYHQLSEIEEHTADKSRSATKSKETQIVRDINETQRYTENEKNDNTDKIKTKDIKKGRKGKKKDKGKIDKNEENKETEPKRSIISQINGTLTKRETFRNNVFDKVKMALSIAYTDGVTHVDVDNVNRLMKSLDISTNQEWFMDLIRSSIIDNLGEIVPLELDTLVMKAQQENVFSNVDECLEAAFKLMDFDEDGFITQKDIRILMLQLGETLGDYAVDDMLLAVDGDMDGKINLRDFRCFLLGRDVPPRKETQSLHGLVNSVKIRAQNEMNIQDSNKESAKKVRTNAEILVDEDKLTKVRSVIKNMKARTNVLAVPSYDKQTLEHIDSHSGPSSTEAKAQDSLLKKDIFESDTTPANSIISPRRQEAVRLKKLFFGGFINKDINLRCEVSHVTQNEEAKKQNEEANYSETNIKPSLLPDENIEVDIHSKILHSLLDTFPALRGELEIGNEDVHHNESLKKSVGVEDLEDHVLDGAWENGSMPSEIENKDTNRLPPDLSVDDVPYLAVKSELSRGQSVRGGNCGPVSVLMANNGFVSQPIEILNKMTTAPNSCPVSRQQSRPSSCRSKNDSAESDDSFKNTLVINLRTRRSSSISSCVLSNNNGNGELEEERRELSYNSDSDDHEGVDSDEGIELVDEEVIKRALHLPLSPKTSLKIYLPRGDVLHSNDPWEDDRSHVCNPRSRITIDLQQFSVDDEDDESVNSAIDDNENDKQNVNERPHFRVNSFTSSIRPKATNEVTNINASFKSPYLSDSFSDEDADDYDEHQNDELKIREVPHLHLGKAIFSANNNKSVRDIEEVSNIKSKERVVQYNHTSEEQFQRKNHENYLYALSLPKPAENHHIIAESSLQVMDKISRQTKSGLGYPNKPTRVEQKSGLGYPNKPIHVEQKSGLGYPNKPTHVEQKSGLGYPNKYTHVEQKSGLGYPNKPTHVEQKSGLGYPNKPTHVEQKSGLGYPNKPTHVEQKSGLGYPNNYTHVEEKSGLGYPNKPTRVEQKSGLGYPNKPTHVEQKSGLGYPNKSTHVEQKSGLGYPNKSTHGEQKLSLNINGIFNSESFIIPKGMSSSPIQGRRATKGDITLVNYSQLPREGKVAQRANVEQLNPELKCENNKHLQSTVPTLQKRQVIEQRRPTLHQNRLPTQNEQGIISDSPNNSYERPNNVNHRKLKRSKTSFEFPIVRETVNDPQTHITNTERSLPKKRSFSATTSRNQRLSSSIKPEYKSISVVDLSTTIQIETPYNKNNLFQQRHHTVSNIVPLSRIVNGFQGRRTVNRNQTYCSVSRPIDKSGVPYFLHNSPRIKTFAWDKEIHHEKIKRRKGHKKKMYKLDKSDPFIISQENEVSTLVGEFKDDDLIPNDVIFSKLRQFKDDV